jgi:hypothetical protein
LAGRIFLANVGVNASHRFSSPVFPDGTFEFIPIPEDRDLSGPDVLRYRDLRSYSTPDRDLGTYIPERLWDRPAHNDPEFETFTYGDNCETTPRAASLKRLESGDVLLFLARLESWRDRGRSGRYGFYLVGFLEVDEVLRDVRTRPEEPVLRRFGANAHVRRALSNPGFWDRFWVFKGTGRSRRFEVAVPIDREIAGRVFTSADGSPWRWDAGRTDLQVIGSYTRSCRCVIDPALPGHAERADALWAWVARHTQ